MNILAVDPGNSCTGLAWEVDGETGLSSVRPKAISTPKRAAEVNRASPMDPIDILVMEVPQVYQRGKSKGDPNDLIRLALLAGAIEALVDATRVIEVLPAAWKGQVPKAIHHRRLRKLIPANVKIKAPVTHDTLDAFGLLLYAKDLLAAEVVARERRRRKKK